MFLVWASGNRDAEQFAHPDEVSLDDASRQHLAFGTGPHQCIGAPLARAELRIAFETLVDRVETFALDEGVTVDALDYAPTLVFRGIERLPMKFDVRST